MAEQEKDSEQPKEDQAPSSSKKKMILIIGGAIGVVVLGAGAAFIFMGGSNEPAPSDPKSTATQEIALSDEKELDPSSSTPTTAAAIGRRERETATAAVRDVGQMYTMKNFNLNLGNPLENHYIRLEIAIEYMGGEEQKAELESRQPQLRDAVVSVVSRKTREFLLGPDGKDQLRREILIRINRVMTRPVQAVYITDILIE
jgi:flagellar protein FliL